MTEYLASITEIISKEFNELRWHFDLLNWVQLFSVLAVFILFLIIPVLTIVQSSFVYQGSLSLYWFQHILLDPLYIPWKGVGGRLFDIIEYTTPQGKEVILFIEGLDFGIILNSIYVASLTTIFSTSIGFILAFIFARYKFFGQEALRIILLTPLLSTPFVGAIGIKKMITSEGVLNTLLVDILRIMPFRIEFTGLSAVILVQTLLFYPIAFLNIYTSIINIDPSLEEQAENMGASGFYLFRTVTLPLSMPGIEAGALLVFILSIEDLGTPIVFRGSNADKLMPVYIFRNMFTPTGTIKGDATALSLILLLISAIIFIVLRKYISLRRYAMLTKGGVWRPRRRSLRPLTTLLIYILCIVILSVALLPHIGVILLAFAGEWPSGSLIPTYFTLRNFVRLFTEPGVLRSILNSVVYASVATILIVILGVSAAYLVSRVKVRGMELLDTLVTLPIAIPGIIIATGFFLVFINTPLSPLIWGAPLLIMSYTVRKFPFTVRAVFAGLEQVDKSLEESAINIGASRTKVFFTITLPLIYINILAGGMLSFIYSMSEVSTGIVIGDANHNDAPMTWKMYDMLFKGFGGSFVAAAMGVMLMTLQFIMIVGSNLLLRKRAVALIGI